MQIVFIYGLHDPRTGELRYIGATKDVAHRLLVHLRRCSMRANSPKNIWLRELISHNLKPTALVLEEANCANWRARERFWIARYRKAGARLTNRNNGGEGGATMTGKRFSEAHRRAISRSLKGHPVSAESRAKFSLRMKGRTPHNRKEFDDVQLRHLYVEELMSARDIAAVFKVTQRPVLRRLRELGIIRKLGAKPRKKLRPHVTKSKVTPQDVKAIRSMIAKKIPYHIIAARFGVNKFSISNIKRGKTWSWLK